MRCIPGVFCFVFVLAVGAVGQDSIKPKPDDKDVLVEELGVKFGRHAAGVNALAFSPDGRRVVSACTQDVRTWDRATGKEIGAVNGLGGEVVALSPEGKSIAITGRQKVTVYDAKSGKELLSVEPHGDWDRTFPFRPAIAAVAFSSDGGRFATAGSVAKVGGPHGLPGGVVTIWDTKTGKALQRFDKLSTGASSVAFSPDGKSVAAGTNGAGGELPEPGEVWIWDLETGEERRHFKAATEAKGGEFISIADVVFSPDGKRLAAAVSSGSRGRPAGLLIDEAAADIRIWKLTSGKALLNLQGHTSSVGRVVFSPDGKQLASAGGDRVVRVWSTSTGKQMKAFPFDAARIDALAFSADGHWLAAGASRNDKRGEFKVWGDMALLIDAAASGVGQTDSPEQPSPETEAQLVAEDKHWQDLDASRQGIKNRVVKILAQTPALDDQQVASAVYLLTMGRSPTDEEIKQAQKEFADTNGRTVRVLNLTRGLVQGKEFNAELAAANGRVFKTQQYLNEPGTKRGIGENTRSLPAEELQKLIGECAAALDKPMKNDEQVVDLTFLLVLSRFPTADESKQVVAHQKKARDRTTATKDIFFFLLNSKEFLVAQ